MTIERRDNTIAALRRYIDRLQAETDAYKLRDLYAEISDMMSAHYSAADREADEQRAAQRAVQRAAARLPRFKVWRADEDQIGDLVLRTGAPRREWGNHDVDYAGTTPSEVAIAAYKSLGSADPISFIVKDFDKGQFYDVVVTPAGVASCTESRG